MNSMTLIRKQELLELMRILSSQRQIQLNLSRFRLLIQIFIRDTIQLEQAMNLFLFCQQHLLAHLLLLYRVKQ